MYGSCAIKCLINSFIYLLTLKTPGSAQVKYMVTYILTVLKMHMADWIMQLTFYYYILMLFVVWYFTAQLGNMNALF